MDLDPEKSFESQRPPKKSDDDDGSPLNEDPKYAKYFKMLNMVRLSCVESSIYVCHIYVSIVSNSSPHLFLVRVCQRELFRMPCNAMNLILQ